MKVLLTLLDQLPRLEDLERLPFAPGSDAGPGPGDFQDRYEREVGREAPGPPEIGGLHRRLADAILAYRVFPDALLSPVLRRAPVQVGDTVAARYHLLPGVDLFFGSRVVAVFDAPEGPLWRTGFTYRTLADHPELGEETFSVEKRLETGALVVALRSWSRPGGLLTRLGRPVARYLQQQANEAALDNLASVARRA